MRRQLRPGTAQSSRDREPRWRPRGSPRSHSGLVRGDSPFSGRRSRRSRAGRRPPKANRRRSDGSTTGNAGGLGLIDRPQRRTGERHGGRRNMMNSPFLQWHSRKLCLNRPFLETGSGRRLLSAGLDLSAGGAPPRFPAILETGCGGGGGCVGSLSRRTKLFDRGRDRRGRGSRCFLMQGVLDLTKRGLERRRRPRSLWRSRGRVQVPVG